MLWEQQLREQFSQAIEDGKASGVRFGYRMRAVLRSVLFGALAPYRLCVNAVAVAVSSLNQSSICVPSSTTRPGGIPKNAVAERALRIIRMNSFFRQIDMRAGPFGSSCSRPRK